MRTSRALSRRDAIGTITFSALAACLLRPRAAVGQPPLGAPILTVGEVEITRIDFAQLMMGTPNLAHDKQFCKMLSGGIRFRAEAEMRPVPGTHPTWFGRLWLLQNVMFDHERWSSKTGLKWCAGMPGQWQLDGQAPYQNRVVHCRPGVNAIDHADDPGVFTEDSTTPYEKVTALPVDLFRTFVVWETTDDSRPPSPTNAAHKHYIGRVDWQWKGVALTGAPGCDSMPYSPVNWGLQDAASDAKGYVGRLALIDPTIAHKVIVPAYQPAAQPEAWKRC